MTGRRFVIGPVAIVVALALAIGLFGCDRGDSGNAPAEPAPTEAAPTKPAPAPGSPSAEPLPAVTPNTFLQRGTPTFVVGTAGDDASDRDVAGQARFLAGLFFPDAAIVADDTIDASAGEAAWPKLPVVYGGPAVNRALAAVAGVLPFEMTADRLVIGGRTFESAGIQLITVVPARATDASGPGHPELLLYAGTGPDGVAEINAVGKGKDVILIADAFGPRCTGHWVRDAGGRVRAELGPDARRIEWRSVERPLPGAHGPRGAKVDFRFPAQEKPSPDDDAIIDAGLRGLAKSIARLQIDDPVSLTFYVYPDARSKQELTGNGGDGHSAPAARALHVRRADTAPDGGVEHLVAHEGTHVLVRPPWGPPGSPLLGEGIAVWASGDYGGVPLAAWKTGSPPAPGPVPHHEVTELMGKTFFATPERETYPFAGLVVDAAVSEVGLAAVGEHLYPATAATWADACKAAGTTAGALQQGR